jgi:hypothetical protein
MAITKRITKGSSLTYQEMDDNLEAIAPRTSATGSIQIPAGSTEQRDGSPQAGYLRYNTSLNQFEGYTTSWGALAGGGGGGEVNQNAFSIVSVAGQTDILAETTTDTLNFAAGTNISITTNAGTDTVTISANFTQDFAWSSLTGTPTTVSGYGIIDAQPLLISGSNIKTINGNSLLGSGDISLTASVDWASITNKPNTISGFGIIDAFDGAWSSLTGTPITLTGYGITDAQSVLVSGSNIKTINGVSVLGSGDLTVTGSYGDSDVSAHLNVGTATTGQILSWNGIDFAWISGGSGGSETDPIVGAINGIVKADGAGNITAAVADTDYSTFDGSFNSLSDVPSDLAGYGLTVSLLELSDIGDDGTIGQVLTTDGNGNFTFQTVSGGGGTSTFLGLTDTPSSFSGSGNQLVAVNAGGTALEFIPQSAGAESNDLSQTVTWAIVPDAFISNTSVVQHQADLRITESQITDLGNYLTTETDPVFSASAVANVVASTSDGFLRNVGGEWYYDTNTYITAAGAETDPVFQAHTTSDIVQGTGFLRNNGIANSWYYDANTYIIGTDVPDNETDPVFSAHTTANINDGSGFLKQDGTGNWFYDTNTYITAAGAESDPVFTAHTTYDIVDGAGFLRNDGGGNWFYDANSYLSDSFTESDPVFTSSVAGRLVDSANNAFLRNDGANNWYYDTNTYITASDIPTASDTLDDVTTRGNSTANSIDVGGLTVNGNTVMIEGSNNALLSNGAQFITLGDLSAVGDIFYDSNTGVFSANVSATGISAQFLSANTVAPDTTSTLTYDFNTGEFTYTPPDLSGYLTSYIESDPIFSAHTTADISNGVGRLVNDGTGNWSYEANTFLESESDPVFTAHTSFNITNGNGFLVNDGAGNWSYDASQYVASGANVSFFTNDAGYLTEEADTFETVTSRGNISFGNLFANGSITAYTTISANNTISSNENLTANGDIVSENGNVLALNGNIQVYGVSGVDGGKITLNAGQTGTPVNDATNWSFIKIERGLSPDVEIRWNETSDLWQFTNDGTNYNAFGSGNLNNVVEDTTPQLGGDLDLNSSDITGTGNISITGDGALSGRVLVGKTSTSFSTPGVEVDGVNKRVWVTRDGAEPLVLNRLTSDGDLLELYKDGTEVGIIGTEGGDLTIGTGNTGLQFGDGGDYIRPWNTSTNAPRDNAVDLGVSTARFKDLYLSGGVYLGGTTSANLLDDYEEGTWTPILTANANCSGLSVAYARYVRIGNMVFYSISGSVTVTSSDTKTAFIFTQAFTQAVEAEPQGGSAFIEGPNPFPYAAGTAVNTSAGTSDGFAAFGSSAVNFNGASFFSIIGSFRAA